MARLTDRIDPSGEVWQQVKDVIARYAERKRRERAKP